ncbi:low-temperature-induced 65 kDa protein isoform X2 [Brassica napus]|uniref:low-temperature-induced 65 kDa protein isoform X2 n=1 Tax=Brassica napus TaxID=3708 RepID=UPI002078619D|nr:low-temperature-induced 65 kDa protein isoform X2 [Brassica napus]
MDLPRPSSGQDQTEDPTQIHHPEEEEHHESRASRMLGKVKAKAKKLKNRLTNHGTDGNEQDHDVVDEEEEDDESDEAESEKHVAPVNEVPNVRDYKTSQPESLTHPGETNVPAPEEIILSETKDSTDYTGIIPEPSRDAAYEHEAPSYPVRTSDVTHHEPLNTPVSLLSETEDVTTPGEDGLLGGQREVNTDMPKRFEDDLSGESDYQSKIPYHTQQGSGEAGEVDHKKSGLGTELASESVTVFGGKPETGPRDDFPAKGREFEQTIGSGIGEDNGAGKEGTERREDFLGKSYEFDQEIESTFGKDSPTRLPGDEIFPTRSDDMEVEIGSGRGLPTETDDDHFSPEFSGPKERDDFDSQAEQTRYEAAEVKPTTYSEMIGSSTGYSSGQHESPVSVETVADKLTTEDENVKETASPVTAKLPFSGDGSEVDETEQGEDKFVASRDHLEEKLTPEEEEDKAFSDMVAEKLNLGEEKQAKIKEEVAEEKIPSDKLPEEIEGGEAVQEEGKEGGGIVGTIKGVYNYWLGGTEEVKPKSPNSVEESSQPLSPSVGTKGFSDSGESGLGEAGSTAGAVAAQKQL